MVDPFVIVGGDAAGLSAASKFQREDGNRKPIVFERGSWVSYAHCGLPYYVKGEVPHLTDVVTLRPDEIEERGIDLRRGHEVVEVDPGADMVIVERDGERIEQPYGDLLIATGARAVTQPIPGTELEGAFTVHSMDQAAALRAYLTPPDAFDLDRFGPTFVDGDLVEQYAAKTPPRSAAIIGGGYVGIEMAEALVAHDLDVHLFQRGGTLLPPFGEAVASTVADTLDRHDISVHLETSVERIHGEDEAEAVSTRERRYDVDLAVVGIGVRPNVDIVENTSIDLGSSGAIAIDAFGRTNVDNVYAAGDCAAMPHAVTGTARWVPLGLSANRAGRAIGQTVAGDPTPVGEIVGTATVKAFDLECARTGIIDHDAAEDAGFSPLSRTITASSRSGYYPGAAPTTVTLTADATTGRLLGGSIVGTDRAAVRIDTVATALAGEFTVADLERLDLKYAPPFSPVWDPILVAAKVVNGAVGA